MRAELKRCAVVFLVSGTAHGDGRTCPPASAASSSSTRPTARRRRSPSTTPSRWSRASVGQLEPRSGTRPTDGANTIVATFAERSALKGGSTDVSEPSYSNQPNPAANAITRLSAETAAGVVSFDGMLVRRARDGGAAAWPRVRAAREQGRTTPHRTRGAQVRSRAGLTRRRASSYAEPVAKL